MNQAQGINIIKEIQKSQSKNFDRGKSWEHCYMFFRKHNKINNDEELLDSAALQLGFFLASWGMLRGSSFLLQKDYRFYIPIIKILTNSKYDILWNVDFLGKSNQKGISLLFELKRDLESEIIKSNKIDGDNRKHQLDLIITKIIMVTMGCIPAYDRYYKEGFKKKYNISVNFNKRSFTQMIDLVKSDEKIKKVSNQSCLIQYTKIKYPPIKLIDLYFWLIGLNK